MYPEARDPTSVHRPKERWIKIHFFKKNEGQTNSVTGYPYAFPGPTSTATLGSPIPLLAPGYNFQWNWRPLPCAVYEDMQGWG